MKAKEHRLNWSQLLSTRRQRPSISSVREDARNEFEKDYHRIVSSASFRRLQDKTQVFPLDQSDFVRTRLTHSLEVSSLSKSLGQTAAQGVYFRGLDPTLTRQLVYEMSDLLLCAGLIHDIGNPPFGHYGETTIRDWFAGHLPRLTYKGQPLTVWLNDQMQADLLHFEGNAQALRVLTKLHFLKDEYGMNLTLPLLNTIIKYPVPSLEIDPGHPDIRYHKMGYFYAEQQLYSDITEATGTAGCRHPLTFLLEAADDIAYRTADLEDAYKKGRFTFDQFRTALYETERLRDMSPVQQQVYLEHCGRLDQKHDEAAQLGVNKPELYAIQNWVIYVQGTLLQLAADNFCNHYDAIMDGVYTKDLFAGTDSAYLLEVLGDIAVNFVFTSKQIISLEIAANQIVGGLLDLFVPACVGWGTGEPQSSLEPRLMAIISDNYRTNYLRRTAGQTEAEQLYHRLLLVTDYICGMTDSFAKTMYQKLTGR